MKTRNEKNGRPCWIWMRLLFWQLETSGEVIDFNKQLKFKSHKRMQVEFISNNVDVIAHDCLSSVAQTLIRRLWASIRRAFPLSWCRTLRCWPTYRPGRTFCVFYIFSTLIYIPVKRKLFKLIILSTSDSECARDVANSRVYIFCPV